MARLYALQKADMRAMEKQGVRENPVRRNGYALQGGAGPDVERFQLASERAEEIQENRENPDRKGATPTTGLSRVRGGRMSFFDKQNKVRTPEQQAKHDKKEAGLKILNAHRGGKHTDAHYEHDREGKLLHETMEAHEAEGRAMKGGRAVPSSGLSQFKGGSCIVGAGRGSEILARESARRPVIRAGLSDEHSVEAKEMGRHLGRHLKAVRGGGFFDLFTKGIVEAGREGADVSKVTGMPNPSPPQMAPPTSGGAIFHRRRDMLDEKEEAHEEHTARRFGRVHKGAGIFTKPEQITSKVMGPSYYNYEPPTTDMGLKPIGFKPKTDFIRDPNRSGSLRQLKGVTSKGGYLSGQYEGMGGGSRSARAEIVKKVMAEKGCSMIEASKYVKAHNLY